MGRNFSRSPKKKKQQQLCLLCQLIKPFQMAEITFCILTTNCEKTANQGHCLPALRLVLATQSCCFLFRSEA